MPSMRRKKKQRNKSQSALTNDSQFTRGNSKSKQHHPEPNQQQKISSISCENFKVGETFLTEDRYDRGRSIAKSSNCEKLKGTETSSNGNKQDLGDSTLKFKATEIYPPKVNGNSTVQTSKCSKTETLQPKYNASSNSIVKSKSEVFKNISLMSNEKLEDRDLDFASCSRHTIGDVCYLTSGDQNQYNSSLCNKVSKIPRLVRKPLESSTTSKGDQSKETLKRFKAKIIGDRQILIQNVGMSNSIETKQKLGKINYVSHESDSVKQVNGKEAFGDVKAHSSPNRNCFSFAIEEVDEEVEISRDENENGSVIGILAKDFSRAVNKELSRCQNCEKEKTGGNYGLNNSQKDASQLEDRLAKDENCDDNDSFKADLFLDIFNEDFCLKKTDNIINDCEMSRLILQNKDGIVYTEPKICSAIKKDEPLEDFEYCNKFEVTQKSTQNTDSPIENIESSQTTETFFAKKDTYVQWYIKNLPYVLLVFLIGVLILLYLSSIDPISYIESDITDYIQSNKE